MKKSIIKLVIIFLLISLCIYPIVSYYNFYKANKLLEAKKYEEAVKEYDEIKNDKAMYNKNLALYLEKKEPVAREEAEQLFNRGNYFYNNKKYKEALDEYWKAMLVSDDINIKKNYELSLQKLEEEKKKDEQKKQDQKDKKNQDKKDKDKKDQNNQKDKKENNQKDKDKQNQENNKQKDEDKKDSSANKENESDKSDDSKDKNKSENNEQQQKKEQDKKQDQNSQNINEEKKDEEKKENQQGGSADKQKEDKDKSEKKDASAVTPTDKDLKDQEVKSFLKLLEKNEKMDLKNNHRVLRRGDEDEDTKKW